jgi:hypothetical protein
MWAAMMKNQWQRFMNRHRRILADVQRIQLEMAQENPRSAPSIFPNTSSKTSTVVIFWVLLVLTVIVCWHFIHGPGR